MKRLIPARVLTALLAAGLSGCQTAGPATLDDIARASDWNLDDGDALAFRFQRDMRRLLVGRAVADASADLGAAGYECQRGGRPDTGAICIKSFATRACQLEWFVTLFPKDAVVEHVLTDSTRDCVGRDRDWPEPKNSAIDDQLAPPKP